MPKRKAATGTSKVPAKRQKPKPATPGTPGAVAGLKAIGQMNVKDLKAELRARGLGVSGTKPVLIARLGGEGGEKMSTVAQGVPPPAAPGARQPGHSGTRVHPCEVLGCGNAFHAAGAPGLKGLKGSGAGEGPAKWVRLGYFLSTAHFIYRSNHHKDNERQNQEVNKHRNKVAVC